MYVCMYVCMYKNSGPGRVCARGDRAAEPDFGGIAFALWFSSGMKSSLSLFHAPSRSLALSLSRSLCNLSRSLSPLQP